MAKWKHAGGSGVGMWPEEHTGIVLQNRHSAALAKGDIVMLDELNSDSLSGAVFTPGSTLSALAGVVRPNTAGIANGCAFLVAEQAVAIDGWGKFTLKSADVLCSIEGALATAVTDILSPQNGALTLDQNNNSGAVTNHTKIIAKVIVAQADTVHTSAAVLTRCRFNGDEGFGMLAHSG